MIENQIQQIDVLLTGGSKFIGPQWARAGGSVLSPRFNFDWCVPGRPENFEVNSKAAGNIGFRVCYKDLAEGLPHFIGRPDSADTKKIGLIATPNVRHWPEAEAMMKANPVRLDGVAIEKPLAHNVEDAQNIAILAKMLGIPTAVLPTYCGLLANLEARHRILFGGESEKIRGGRFAYLQGWLRKKLAEMTDDEGRQQAMWRKNALLSGPAGALGDIASHLLFQLAIISGLSIAAVKRANRRFVVEGPEMEDPDGFTVPTTDDHVLFTAVLSNGAEISIEAVQFAEGRRNDNSWELWTEKNSYKWDIAGHPEVLWVGNEQVAADGFSTPLKDATHSLPAFHADSGWTGAGGRILQWFGWEITNTRPDGIEPFPFDALLGLNINKVIGACIESADNDGQEVETGWVNSWDDLPDQLPS